MAEGTDVIRRVDKAVASVNKGADKKEEMMMMVAPYANWGEYLVPAPLSIALLGELILISGNTDFSLEKKPPKDGFQLLKYPSSFRASLVQVSHAGWEAFNSAHTNMDQIRLHSANVDGHVRNAVKFLIGGSNEEVELMVPKALKNVQKIADECVSLVTSVENKFIFVMKLTAELLEACTNAQGQYEEDLKTAEVGLQIANENERTAKLQKENAEKQYEAMKKEMEDNQKMMKDAIKSIPSGWEMIGMNFVEGLSNAVTGILGSFSGRLSGSGSYRSSRTASKSGENSAMETPEEESNRKAYSKAPTLAAEVVALGDLLNGGKPDWAILKQGDRLRFVNGRIDYGLKSLQELLAGPVQKEALQLHQTAKQLCAELQQAAQSLSRDPKDIQDIYKRYEGLEEKVVIFEVKAKRVNGVNPMSSKGPQMAKVQLPAQAGGSAVQAAMQNAQLKIDTATHLIKDSQGRYDSSIKTLKESNDELGKVLAEIAKFDMQKINFEKIRETLIKGIKALAQLREQWGKLVLFFQTISNLIRCSLDTSLKEFIETTKAGQTLALKGVTLSNLLKDTIYEEAFQANKIAYVVQMISGSYVEISNHHLMDRITCLDSLLALDPKKDEAQILRKRNELHSGCRDAQEAIGQLVMEKKRDFDEQVEKRVAAIENALQDVLPRRSEAAIQESKALITSALDSVTDDDVDQYA